MAWLARILLIAGGVVASWFVAKDTPAFTIAQGMMAIVLLTILVAVLAFWPSFRRPRS